MEIYVIHPLVSEIRNNCIHYMKSIRALLMTCKLFSEYLPIKFDINLIVKCNCELCDIVNILISEAINGNKCIHYVKSIRVLLMTCKLFAEYLPIGLDCNLISKCECELTTKFIVALRSLMSYGKQDLFLMGNPNITFHKTVYRRHTNFAIEK